MLHNYVRLNNVFSMNIFLFQISMYGLVEPFSLFKPGYLSFQITCEIIWLEMGSHV